MFRAGCCKDQMQLEVGKIYEGKVTGITKFGAFVELDKEIGRASCRERV